MSAFSASPAPPVATDDSDPNRNLQRSDRVNSAAVETPSVDPSVESLTEAHFSSIDPQNSSSTMGIDPPASAASTSPSAASVDPLPPPVDPYGVPTADSDPSGSVERVSNPSTASDPSLTTIVDPSAKPPAPAPSSGRRQEARQARPSPSLDLNGDSTARPPRVPASASRQNPSRQNPNRRASPANIAADDDEVEAVFFHQLRHGNSSFSDLGRPIPRSEILQPPSHGSSQREFQPNWLRECFRPTVLNRALDELFAFFGVQYDATSSVLETVNSNFTDANFDEYIEFMDPVTTRAYRLPRLRSTLAMLHPPESLSVQAVITKRLRHMVVQLLPVSPPSIQPSSNGPPTTPSFLGLPLTTPTSPTTAAFSPVGRSSLSMSTMSSLHLSPSRDTAPCPADNLNDPDSRPSTPTTESTAIVVHPSTVATIARPPTPPTTTDTTAIVVRPNTNATTARPTTPPSPTQPNAIVIVPPVPLTPVATTAIVVYADNNVVRPPTPTSPPSASVPTNAIVTSAATGNKVVRPPTPPSPTPASVPTAATVVHAAANNVVLPSTTVQPPLPTTTIQPPLPTTTVQPPPLPAKVKKPTKSPVQQPSASTVQPQPSKPPPATVQQPTMPPVQPPSVQTAQSPPTATAQPPPATSQPHTWRGRTINMNANRKSSTAPSTQAAPTSTTTAAPAQVPLPSRATASRPAPAPPQAPSTTRTSNRSASQPMPPPPNTTNNGPPIMRCYPETPSRSPLRVFAPTSPPFGFTSVPPSVPRPAPYQRPYKPGPLSPPLNSRHIPNPYQQQRSSRAYQPYPPPTPPPTPPPPPPYQQQRPSRAYQPYPPPPSPPPPHGMTDPDNWDDSVVHRGEWTHINISDDTPLDPETNLPRPWLSTVPEYPGDHVIFANPSKHYGILIHKMIFLFSFGKRDEPEYRPDKARTSLTYALQKYQGLEHDFPSIIQYLHRFSLTCANHQVYVGPPVTISRDHHKGAWFSDLPHSVQVDSFTIVDSFLAKILTDNTGLSAIPALVDLFRAASSGYALYYSILVRLRLPSLQEIPQQPTVPYMKHHSLADYLQIFIGYVFLENLNNRVLSDKYAVLLFLSKLGPAYKQQASQVRIEIESMNYLDKPLPYRLQLDNICERFTGIPNVTPPNRFSSRRHDRGPRSASPQSTIHALAYATPLDDDEQSPSPLSFNEYEDDEYVSFAIHALQQPDRPCLYCSDTSHLMAGCTKLRKQLDDPRFLAIMSSILRNFKGDTTRMIKTVRALSLEIPESGDGSSSPTPPESPADSSVPDFR